MKTILLIRHAKAESVFTINDFERSLNERGKDDITVMAKRFLKKKIKIDAFVSSPAKRAKKTAELFCEACGQNEKDIIYVTALYQAPENVFYEEIAQLDNSFNVAAIFAHNPGITNFANDLSAEVKVDNIPTCGIFAVKADIDHWNNFRKSKKEFLFFDYPKNA